MLKVMLVDDTLERVQTLRLALAQAGYEVIEHAGSTVDLHRRVAAIKPDVIIIDTDSPDRDTIENLCVISRDEPRPVVMFTHDDDSTKIREAVRAGVSAYVVDGLALERVKPIIDVAIARFEQFQALRLELAQNEEKLAERKVVERAKGILMKGRNLSEDEAYRALRQQAMDNNTRLGDVARQVIALAGLLLA